MMYPLTRKIASKLAESPRLRGVAIPVIEEVIEQALAELENITPSEMTLERALGDEADTCEGCGQLVWIGDQQCDSDGVVLCKQCVEDCKKAESSGNA